MVLEKIFEVINYFRLTYSFLLINVVLFYCLAKTRTLDQVPKSSEEIPRWHYAGSSTGEAEDLDSDIYLKPIAMFKDPFMLGQNILVMCETYKYTNEPTGKK